MTEESTIDAADRVPEHVDNPFHILFEARLTLQRGEPLPVDLLIKLREIGVDPDILAAHCDL